MTLLTPAGARETPERHEAGATHPAGLVAGYDAGAFFDEMTDGAHVEGGLTQRIRARNHKGTADETLEVAVTIREP